MQNLASIQTITSRSKFADTNTGDIRVHIVKGLTELGSDISVENEAPFCQACENGHLKMAKWLLSVKPDIDISANDEYAFCCSCEKGFLKVAKWLLSVKSDIDISAGLSHCNACRPFKAVSQIHKATPHI